MVEYVDGSILAQLGNPDMRTPIAHALGWPERIGSGVESLDLVAAARLDFEAPDLVRFPALVLARAAAEAGGTAPAALNAANEVAVAAFLEGRLDFLGIPALIDDVMGAYRNAPAQRHRGHSGGRPLGPWPRAGEAGTGCPGRSMTILTYILAFLVAIGILVAVHEYGHFWMARRMGIKVLRFSIGFGRVLWSRRGADETEYAFSAIPLGGYVKLLDEREGPVDPAIASQAYNRKPVWRRILVLLAGPFANFLFAVVAYWILLVVGTPALKPVIGDVTADSIASRAGLRSGDAIVGVAGKPVATREGAVLAMLDRLMDGTPIELEVQAAGGTESPRELELVIAGDAPRTDRAGRAHVGPRLRFLVSHRSRRRSARSCRAVRRRGPDCRSAIASSPWRTSRLPISSRW